jgi:gamma-tubulin complex component 5
MNIIQRSSIPIYQQMFTLLLQTYRAKYVVQRISPSSIRQIADLRHRQLSYKLRQRLIWFADSMRSYLAETVIEINTSDMIGAMTKAEDIDEMASIHIKYVARLQDQALLSENLKPIHKGIIQILDLAVTFAVAHAADDTSKRTASRNVSTSKPSKLSKSSRRKSVIPTIMEDIDVAGSDDAAASKIPAPSSLGDSLLTVEKEFERLLPFVTAGLRSVGRVGAEPVWEMLAERLGWAGKS